METQLRNASDFGQILKKERRRQGLTQQDLADLAGVSVRFLGSLENGKDSCEFARVLQVASTLGVLMYFRTPE